LIFAAYLGSVWQALGVIPVFEQHYQEQLSPVVICSLVSLSHLLFWSIVLGKSQRWNIPWFTSLGMLTYPLYLIHQNIGYMLFNRFHLQVNESLLLGLVLGGALLFSYWVSHKVEKPCARALHGVLERGLSVLQSVGGRSVR